MRIGVFTNAYKPIINGIVHAVDLFRRGLEGLGHEVFIFAPAFPGYEETDSNVHRFRSINLSTKIKYPLAIPISQRIFNLIPTLGLDVIHAHHPYILGEVGADMAKKLHIPLVYTFHTQFEQYAHYVPLPQSLVRYLAKTSVLAYTQKCSLILTPAPSIRALLDSYGVTTPVEMLPNAIDLTAFRSGDGAAVRDRHGIGPKDQVLLYVGRMGLEKNLGMLLQAFTAVAARAPDSRLMLVGEGPEVEALQALARRLGIGSRTIFAGRVEYADVPAYYAAANLFVMTSITEVKPLALLEAMAAGLPIVAVAANGSSDTVTSGYDGVLTGADPAAFTEACVTLLTNPDLCAAMASNARRTSEQYSILNTSRTLEDIYRRVIDHSGGQRTSNPLRSAAGGVSGRPPAPVPSGNGPQETAPVSRA